MARVRRSPREAGQGGVQAFLDRPAPPRWHPPFMAATLTGFALGPTIAAATGNLLAGCAIVAASAVALARYHRRRGNRTRVSLPLREAPREIRHAYAWRAAAVVLAVVVSGILFVTRTQVTGLLSLFFLLTVGIRHYESTVYPQAVEAVRRRRR